MKKQKLSLNSLKVESFVTNLDKKNSQTVNGGNGDVMPSGIQCGGTGIACPGIWYTQVGFANVCNPRTAFGFPC